MRRKYRGHGVNLENIEEVDFVWSGEPFPELIGDTGCYDWIIASHVIEHVPDLITFFQQCETLLKPQGILSLVIPDKRFCFDPFSPVSSTGNLLDAYAEKCLKPNSGQVFDCFANASKRNGNIAWADDSQGEPDELVHQFSDSQDHWARSISTADYIDTHCRRFTPSSFRLILTDIQKLNLTTLGIFEVYDTEGCEFYVSLRKNFPQEDFERFELLGKILKNI